MCVIAIFLSSFRCHYLVYTIIFIIVIIVEYEIPIPLIYNDDGNDDKELCYHLSIVCLMVMMMQ